MYLPKTTHANYTTLISDIEKGQVKIPQFQRDFVWSVQDSAALLDSIIKGYPVGTFIFWSTKERLRSVRNLGGINLPNPKDGEIVKFVLDGQQRLTSLFAALKGLEVERESGQLDDFSNIYIDLEASESDQIILIDIAGRDEYSCIRLTDLLEGAHTLIRKFPEKYIARIDEYKIRIKSFEFPIIEIQDVALDVATEIFTRINVSGKRLSLFEIMVAKTYDENQQFDLSEKFNDLVDELTPYDYETISDATVLQVVALILKKECKRQTILNLPKEDFIQTWGAAVDAIRRAVEFFRSTYRIPVSQLLPYNALLVPFSYFFYHHHDKPEPEQARLLEDFFWRCALGGRYSSSVESKLAQDVNRIEAIMEGRSPDYDWGLDITPGFLIENGWFNTGRSFVKAILCILAYHEPKSFSDNSKVDIQNYWLKQSNSKNYHHFFPRAFLRKRGVDDELANNVLNITIVDDFLNKRLIRDKAPSVYMREFENENSKIEDTMKTHLIDDLVNFGVMEDDFDLFLNQRAMLISKELDSRIIRRNVDEHGQVSKADDFDEHIVAYE